MSVKVKDIDWEQDKDKIRVKVGLTGVTSMKGVEVYLSDCVLRVNVAEKKIVKVLDLEQEVDFLTQENKFGFGNQYLECTIKKKRPAVWNHLLVRGLDKQQLIDRRKASFARREEYQQKFIEEMKNIRIQQDKFSTQEQMRMEDQERHSLLALKAKEKQEAERFIYEGIDDNLEGQQRDSSGQFIFEGEEDRPIRILPEVRGNGVVDLAFTEKVYANLAAREQHFQEAPLPQLKKMAANENNKLNMNEIKNPAWLKDKGDELVKKGEYLGGVSAYKSSLKLSPNNLCCLSNLALSHLQMFNYNESLHYIQQLLDAIDCLSNEDRITHFQLLVKNQARKAMCLAWRGDLEQSVELIEHTLSLNIKDQHIQLQLQQMLQQVSCRIKQRDIKHHGNHLFQLGHLDQAMQSYQQALQIEGDNETILANMSLILLQKGQYEQALQYCQQALDIMYSLVNFQNIIQDINNNYDKHFDASLTIEVLIKQLYRKATLLQKLGKIEEALQICREIISIDIENKETRSLQSSLQKEQKQQNFLSLKTKATSLMHNNQLKEAIITWKEAQQNLEKEAIFDNLAVMLNKCVCYMKLQQWQDTVSTSIQGLNIITNYTNRVIAFQQQQNQAKLLHFKKVFLVRRGNSYLQLGQIYNAKQDLEDALQIMPDDVKLQEDIQALKQAIQQA